MKRMITRIAAAAGSLALLGGAIAAATPADAAPIGNGAYGAATGGTIFTYPVANATVGNSPVVASNANVAGLLATGVIVDRADPGGASSRITQGVVLNLPFNGKLQADGLRSWCRTFDGDVFGGVTIFNGRITYFNRSDNAYYSLGLPMHPPANDVIDLPVWAGGGTITLNDQTGGSERGFAAVYANLPGNQRVVLAVSGCRRRHFMG